MGCKSEPVGVQTFKTVNQGDTTVTLNKVDGLVSGQDVTMGDGADVYTIAKVTLPTIDIAPPGALVGVPAGAAIVFSRAAFARLGTVDSPSRSYDADHTLNRADRYVTVTATSKQTLPASPVDGQTHDIKSGTGVTTTVETEDPGPPVPKLKVDGQASVTLAPGDNGTFRYSAVIGEWEIR